MLGKNHLKKSRLEKSIQEINKEKEKIHDKRLEEITNSPEKINIPDRFYSAETETRFYNEKGEEKGRTDIIIETKDEIYAIEYKTTGHRNAQKNAKEQLIKTKKFLGINITKLLYVFGKYNVKELTEGGYKPFP